MLAGTNYNEIPSMPTTSFYAFPMQSFTTPASSTNRRRRAPTLPPRPEKRSKLSPIKKRPFEFELSFPFPCCLETNCISSATSPFKLKARRRSQDPSASMKFPETFLSLPAETSSDGKAAPSLSFPPIQESEVLLLH